MADTKIEQFSFVTDTATLCTYDLQCLKHRLDDDPDWWSISEDELEEVNQGNVAFVNLGVDGKFFVDIAQEIDSDSDSIVCNLNYPSGKVFIGAGEEVTSDGLEATGIRGGKFIDLLPGSYKVIFKKINTATVLINFHRIEGKAKNSFEVPLRFSK